MTRMLEALRKAEGKHLRLHAGPPAKLDCASAAADGVEPEEADIISFIEVGGRGEPLEASPDVLAFGPVKKGIVTPITAASPAAGASPALVEISPPPEVVVQFRPLHAEPVPLAPAAERFAPELVAFHRPLDPVSEQYRDLFKAIEAELPAGRSQVLLFTGAAAGAGTTTALLNLAITCVRSSELSVTLVDASPHRPALAARLGLRSVPGLSEVLAGTISLEQALQQTAQSNLLALTAGRVRTLSTDNSPLRTLLSQLRDKFDRVYVDLGRWQGGAQAIALAAASDAVYLVLSAAEELSAATDTLLRTIPQQGGRLHGCIITKR